jgi:hypothetical protein
MKKPRLCVLLIAALALADAASDLLTAARKGQVNRLTALTAKGAALETRDKSGRTPLLLAAQHGHADAVRLLREKGANPAARDEDGYTAYALALLSSSDGRETVLKLLPKPPVVRVALEARLAPGNLYGSCFMPPPQLARFVTDTHPETMVLDGILHAAATPGISRDLIPMEFVQDGGEGTAIVSVRPQVSCVQSADNVSLAIDVRVTIAQKVVLEKTFGGGLKGLHARAVTSPAQYTALFGDWAKSHAAEIYWAIAGSTMRS